MKNKKKSNNKERKFKLAGSINIAAGLNFIRAIEENPYIEAGIPDYNLQELKNYLEGILEPTEYKMIVDLYGLLSPRKAQKEIAIEYHIERSTLSKKLNGIVDGLREDPESLKFVRSLAPSVESLHEEICELRSEVKCLEERLSEKDNDKVPVGRLRDEISKREAAVQGNKILQNENASLKYDNEQLKKELSTLQCKLSDAEKELNDARLALGLTEKKVKILYDGFVKVVEQIHNAAATVDGAREDVIAEVDLAGKTLIAEFGLSKKALVSLERVGLFTVEAVTQHTRPTLTRLLGKEVCREVESCLRKHGYRLRTA